MPTCSGSMLKLVRSSLLTDDRRAVAVVLQELEQRLSRHFAAADKKPAPAAAAALAHGGAAATESAPIGADAAGQKQPFKMSYDDALPLQVCVGGAGGRSAEDGQGMSMEARLEQTLVQLSLRHGMSQPTEAITPLKAPALALACSLQQQ